jgi:hypothetical protein
MVWQTGSMQDKVSRHTLVFEIMDGVANALIGHAVMLVYFIQQYRNQSSLPIVAVNNIWPTIVLEQELHRRLAEKCKPLDIIIEAVIPPALEEMVAGVRLYEKTLSTMDEAKPHIARDSSAIPRYPQVAIGDLQTPNMVVAHTVILGKDDMHIVATYLQLPGEPENDISQSPNLGNGSALGRNHYDVHIRYLNNLAASRMILNIRIINLCV